MGGCIDFRKERAEQLDWHAHDAGGILDMNVWSEERIFTDKSARAGEDFAFCNQPVDGTVRERVKRYLLNIYIRVKFRSIACIRYLHSSNSVTDTTGLIGLQELPCLVGIFGFLPNRPITGNDLIRSDDEDRLRCIDGAVIAIIVAIVTLLSLESIDKSICFGTADRRGKDRGGCDNVLSWQRLSSSNMVLIDIWRHCSIDLHPFSLNHLSSPLRR